MKTVKIKAYGKINIGLNVKGVVDNYHALETVMAKISFFDTVILKTRKDYNINLNVSGCGVEAISTADNNVYKTAKAFMERFGTFGADITLKKNIPIGSGLGGSSADIVGTAQAFAKAYGIDDDLTEFVNTLCSDGEFLLNENCALVCERGQVQRKVQLNKKLYLVIVTPNGEHSTKDVFGEFDKGYDGENLDIQNIICSLEEDKTFDKKEVFNALYLPACSLNGEIRSAYEDIRSLSPEIVSMSGSGTSVYGVFESVDLCLWAQNKLERKWSNVFVKESL